MSSEPAGQGFTVVLRISTSAEQELDRVVTGMKPAAVFSLTPFTPDERAVLDHRQGSPSTRRAYRRSTAIERSTN